MKIEELGIDLEEGTYYSQDKEILNYLNQDCIVAYNKNKASVVFVIKTKKTYMGFYHISKVLLEYQYHYKALRRITLNQALQLIENEGVIVDEEGYSKFKRKIILQNLK